MGSGPSARVFTSVDESELDQADSHGLGRDLELHGQLVDILLSSPCVSGSSETSDGVIRSRGEIGF